jgi:hypothetical protein
MAVLEPLTDAVKAIREAIGLVDDLITKVGDRFTGFQDQNKRRAVADSLTALRFDRDGFREILQDIVQGNDMATSLQQLERRFTETAGRIGNAISNLEMYRDFVRTKEGMLSDHDLENLIHLRLGRMGIRATIARIIVDNAMHRPPAKEHVREVASQLLKAMDLFNGKLGVLHDKILKLGS